MDEAKAWIREAVEGKHPILICPDKDADGLSSAAVLSLALRALEHPPDLVSIYHLPRSLNIHAPAAQSDMLGTFPSRGGPTRCIVLDQGSRPGLALLPPGDDPSNPRKTLIIDHHLSTTFPDDAQVLTACHSLPVATTSILTYHLCAELVPSLRGSSSAGLAALVGVYGDLGSGKVKFGAPDEPWPASIAPVEKAVTKSALSKAVALINAPRRTPEFGVQAAFEALWAALDAEEGAGAKGWLRRVLEDDKLLEAKERTSAETSRWQGAPPVFSKDGRIAVVTVDSGYQIHPVIATRWTGTLRKAKTLICVMCANTGYTPGFVHFSCRAPRRDTSSPVDLIAFLRSLAPQCDALSLGWSARVGEDFARGHREATGGIIPRDEFDVLLRACEVGVKKEKGEGDGAPKKTKAKGVIDEGMKKGALEGFFKVVSKKGAAGKAGDEEKDAKSVPQAAEKAQVVEVD
ncbi:hypothetical protein Rhopal_007113-T1 [Rhodotorula paludigena]|uniref:DDH domain-containing protein n=1 Tax=Rhodotorula paludigena TaxID=86838 RepID=A0AAV5GX38_9BASI|nr:hypothetical protein Rhopal_007113-T1 [Rhodotorula paludigena]